MNQVSVMNVSERRAVDILVREFWRLGYFTLSRRLGTFLPEPGNIGRYTVDAIGRQNEKYAIGINLTKEEIFNPNLIEKINYLASRKTRFSDRQIILLIGVPEIYFKQVKEILLNVDLRLRKNIKLTRIVEENIKNHRQQPQKQQVIFS